ncbi:MAG: response regulator [Burkholderiaceae bacterium]|nr:MAG: response regulator [Burkholderiaceae bacterium]
MSNSMQSHNPAAVDTGPLSWVLGEIREALSRSEQAIDAFSKSDGMDGTQLKHARSHLHQAHGALQVVDLDGVALVTEEVEHLYEHFESEPQLCDDAAVDAIRRGFRAVVEYLQDLMGGHPHQPVRLFPYYRALLAVRSADRIHPADLFFPDLSARPPKGEAPAQPLTPEQLRRARAQFERGLLTYLRDPQDHAAINSLHQAVESIELTQRAGPQRAFWWVTLAFLDALQNDAVPTDLNVKRLCARINLQMRRILDGTATVADRLLKDTLFFVARSGDVSPRIAHVKQFYQLENAVPKDFEEARYGVVDSQTSARLHEALEGAKAAWARVVGGAANELKTFAVDAIGLRDTVQGINQPELVRLTQGIANHAVALQKSSQSSSESLGLEMATALLMAELALDNLHNLEEGFGERVDVMLGRLSAAAEGQALEEHVPWLQEMAQQAQQRLFMASLVQEIQNSLSQVEKAMDAFFRDPTQKEDLPGTQTVLNQVAGALGLLGHTDAVAAVRVVQQAVEEFVRPDYQPDRQRFNFIAQNCGALGFFAEALQHPARAATHEFHFDPATGEFRASLTEPKLRQTAPHGGEETDSAFYRDETGASAGGSALPKFPAHPESSEFDAGVREAGAVSESNEAVPSPAFELLDEVAASAAMDDTLLPTQDLIGVPFPSLDAGHDDFSLSHLHALSTKPEAAPLLDPARSAVAASGGSLLHMSEAQIDAELLEIFLGEADEVVQAISAALGGCEEFPENQELLTTIRRGFHTLKGSSRMVGLAQFGEASWALEQTLNLWLAERRAATPELLHMVRSGLAELNAWVAEIRINGASSRTPDAMIALARGVREGLAAHSQDSPSIHGMREMSDMGDAEEIVAVALPDETHEMEELPALHADFSIEGERFRTAVPVLAEMPAMTADDTVRIGDLTLSAPLYNIFLSEADDLLRALQLDISEWQHEMERPVSAQATRCAHSLAGSSATVGLSPVNQLAGALERLFNGMTRRPLPLMAHEYEAIELTANVLRDMVQKFAAGQLPDAAPGLCETLNTLKERYADVIEVVPPVDDLEQGAAEIVVEAVVEDGHADEIHIEVPPVPEPATIITAEPGQKIRHLHVQGGVRDDIDAELLPIFIEEAQDYLPQIAGLLRQWREDTSDRDLPQQLLRDLHTVKGSARMAGAMRMGQVVHEMEARVESAQALTFVPQSLMEDLQADQDRLQLLLDELVNPGAFVAAQTEAVASAEAELADDASVDALAVAPEADADIPDGISVALQPDRRVATRLTAPAAAGAAAAQTQAAMVRVRADVLDRLVNQAGEVSITRSRVDTEVTAMRSALSDLTENMQRLRSQLREIEIQAEAQMSTRVDSDHLREFDPLEFDRFTRFQEITRMMAESVSDVGTVHQNLVRSLEGAEEDLIGQSRITRELQQDLMRVRMVPFGNVSERLYRVVRLAAKEMDKRVNLDIRGLQVEMDRGVLEKMVGPFEHLLRNAVAHGVEQRAARVAAGKSEVGELLIEVRQEGNEVVITFSDDGGGLNLPRIRERAVAMGLLTGDTEVSERAVAEMIFTPGFSTVTEVTELAGRGVGMDVVRSEAAALGGRVDLESTPGAGSRFTIHLPLTLAITQVVLVRVGGQKYSLPAVLVEQVQQLKPQALANAYNERGIVWQNSRIEMHYLATLLGVAEHAPMAQRYSPVMILRSGTHRVAVHIDEILGNIEAVVKNIGPQLAHVAGIAGATVLGTGEIVMILNPVQLALSQAVEARSHLLPADGHAEVMGAVAEILAPDTETTVPVSGLGTTPTVMVVDDSLTVRKVTQRLLVREGYQVVLAKDGVDALRQMQDYTPDVMLVDIEMPRMDGFDLTRNVRGDDRFKNIPIIMITSRTADKHRNYAMSLGVNEYLGKPYQEEQLLAYIKRFLNEGKARASA